MVRKLDSQRSIVSSCIQTRSIQLNEKREKRRTLLTRVFVEYCKISTACTSINILIFNIVFQDESDKRVDEKSSTLKFNFSSRYGRESSSTSSSDRFIRYERVTYEFLVR